jgi:hypothetical protein
MIVPDYWAEARVQGRLQVTEKGGQRSRSATVRRFGWSNESQAAAQAHAEERAQQAWRALLAGERTQRRELKMSYGAPGVPIREEVVARHGAGAAEAVITRNAYGALCLNTPGVLFADIDFPEPRVSAELYIWGAVAAAVLAGVALHSWWAGLALVIAALFAGSGMAVLHQKWLKWRAPEPEGAARARVEAFVAARPEWRARLYRTPAGLRVLAMHRLFDPAEPAVAECFAALQADQVYGWMCQHQHCFRARVSPKPWRIGISAHLLPRPGVWPIRPERLPDRRRWVEAYERAAQGYAACRLIGEIGAGAQDPAALAVQAVHDTLCRAREDLPIA